LGIGAFAPGIEGLVLIHSRLTAVHPAGMSLRSCPKRLHAFSVFRCCGGRMRCRSRGW
jgi:hypothetical protein